MPSFKNLFISLILFLLGCFFALGISELFFRLFPRITGIYSTANYSLPAIYVQDEKRGYALLPMSYGRNISLHGDFNVVYRINSQGLRAGKNYYGKKSDIRVLLLGDSFIFGNGVRDSETLSVKLEENLNDRDLKIGNKLVRFEVISAGVAGYTLDNEYMTLEYFKFLDSDMVLLGLCSNDIQDILFHKWVIDHTGNIVKVIETTRHIDSHHRFVNGPESLYEKNNYLEWLFEFCRRHLFVYNFLGTLRYRNRDSGEPQNRNFTINQNERQEGLDRARKVLSLIKEWCDRNGAKLVIFSVDDVVFKKYPELKTSSLNAPVMDISELFKENKKLTLPHDAHWSVEGTVKVANWLADFIQEKKMFIRKINK